MTTPETIAYALLGGILPALLWLFLWLEEDRKNPEPHSRLLKTFLYGMLAVIVVIPLQRGATIIFPGLGAITLLIWATLEEILKFLAAFLAIRSADDDEPIDALIYMITAALGFAALENALFILNPLLEANIIDGIMTGNIRFIGTSLLHVVSSAVIGSALALSFYKPWRERVVWCLGGFLIAILIHTSFNIVIIEESGGMTFKVFAVVWSLTASLFLFFEKVKAIQGLSPK